MVKKNAMTADEAAVRDLATELGYEIHRSVDRPGTPLYRLLDKRSYTLDETIERLLARGGHLKPVSSKS
jgi:hypothetical protein